MRWRLRFHLELLLIAVAGGFLGFAIAQGRLWSSGVFIIVALPIAIYKMGEQYRPDAAERREWNRTHRWD